MPLKKARVEIEALPSVRTESKTASDVLTRALQGKHHLGDSITIRQYNTELVNHRNMLKWTMCLVLELLHCSVLPDWLRAMLLQPIIFRDKINLHR
eukprot:2911331-Amphidinium_carterae.1